MRLNDCPLLVSAVSFNLYLCSIPVYLTTFCQIPKLYDVEWGTLVSVFNWGMAESECGLFYGGFPEYS
jgi:hypothetical protein